MTTEDIPNRDAIDAVHLGHMGRAKTLYASQTGEFRNVYAQAERMGVNVPAAKQALKLRAKDGSLEGYLKDVRDTLHYMRIFGVRPKPEQVDFFDQDPSLIPLEEKAWEDGRVAALLEEGSAVNPHDENSKVGRKWAAGWSQGRKERELVMAMEPDSDDAETDADGEEHERDGDGEFDEAFPQAAE